jgi:long-chain fatty acid transport protein
MTPPHRIHRRLTVQAGAIAAIGLLAADPAGAGGLLLYEVGTADLGLASAGYTARAQDASTVFTNPAGMTRLDGTQVVLGAQVLYADLVFSIGQGTAPELGRGDGGNPVGLFPGGGLFLSYSVSPDLKLGFASTGNFGLAQKYDSGWAGRYYVQEATLIGMSLLPSVAWRVSKEVSVGASLNAVYGVLKEQVAVNNIVGPDGQMVMDTNAWGFGVNLGLMVEPSTGTRFGVTYNSQVKLDFSAPAEFSGLSPVLEALLRSRGLLNATLDIPIYIPQGVNASVSHRLDDRWTLLGSVGWQQWSKFGQVELGVNSTTDPTTLKTHLNIKDTWHVAGGAQYRLDGPWLLNKGVAYDSGFQDSANVSPALPANSAWRFGIGVQKEQSKSFDWAVSAAYIYGGSLDVNKVTSAPVIAGGRGRLVGSFDNVGMYFLSATFNWKL